MLVLAELSLWQNDTHQKYKKTLGPQISGLLAASPFHKGLCIDNGCIITVQEIIQYRVA